MSKSKKTVARAALDAKNAKRVRKAIDAKKIAKKVEKLEAIKEAAPPIASLVESNVAAIQTARVENTQAEEQALAKAMSNAPAYAIENVIADAMHGAVISGKAESGMVVSLFSYEYANGERYTLKRIGDYFKAPMTQTVTRPDGTKFKDTSIHTRLMHQNAFLSQCEEYKLANAAFEGLRADYKATKKGKDANKTSRLITLNSQIENDRKPLVAAQNMFHRAMFSLYKLRAENYVKCALGPNNELLVETHDAKHAECLISDTRAAGNDLLKKAGFIKTREQPETPKDEPKVEALSAVNAATARPIIDKLTSMVMNGKLPIEAPEVAEGSVAPTDQNQVAEFALAFVRSLDAKALVKSPELKGTLSQIAVPLMLLLNVKTRDEMVKLARRAPNYAA
jgi:hypothetical protein